MSEKRNLVSPHSHYPWNSLVHSSRAQVMMDAAAPTLLKALDDLSFPEKGAVMIVDYGAHNAACSMKTIETCIDKILSKYGRDKQIHIVYEDQPINDFNALFQRLHGLNPKTSDCLMKNKNVFVTACGTSFYNQCLPDQTVHLGLCFTSAHWLQDRVKLEGSEEMLTEHDKHILVQKGKEDWELFLQHRTKELVSGGQLLLGLMLRLKPKEDNGTELAYFTNTAAVWKAMGEEGYITKTEVRNVVSWAAHYNRPEEEWRSPFTDTNSVIYKSGLQLVSAETKDIQCPFYVQWKRHAENSSSDIGEDFWREYVSAMRYWQNWTYHSALDDSRSEEEKITIIDELYNRYHSHVAKNPDKFLTSTSPMLYLHLKKV